MQSWYAVSENGRFKFDSSEVLGSYGGLVVLCGGGMAYTTALLRSPERLARETRQRPSSNERELLRMSADARRFAADAG